MRKINPVVILFISSLTMIFLSCATSTGSRYSKDESDKGKDSSVISEGNNIVKLNEDFDITPYKTKIEIPENKKNNQTENNDIWYDYETPATDKQQKTLVGTEEGFRVLVVSSDNLEDAEQTKSEIANVVDNNELYIDFDPPFYKLKVGDFHTQTSADNLRFKLNQLGYKEARVVKETINVFK